MRGCAFWILVTPISKTRAIAGFPKIFRSTASKGTNDDDYVFICAIVRGEILFGIEQMPIGCRRQTVENQAVNLFERMPCFAVPESAGDAYAKIKRAAQRQGTPLGENDLWIAATALALDAVLVTADTDFQRIVGLGLAVEDWSN